MSTAEADSTSALSTDQHLLKPLYKFHTEHVDEPLLVLLVCKKLIFSHGKMHVFCEGYHCPCFPLGSSLVRHVFRGFAPVAVKNNYCISILPCDILRVRSAYLPESSSFWSWNALGSTPFKFLHLLLRAAKPKMMQRIYKKA